MPLSLSNRQVPDAMYNRARAVINNGGKVFLITPGSIGFQGVGCKNCDGIGQLGLQIITGGPYDSPSDKKHVINYDGSWYTTETILFPCPICHGSGAAPAVRERATPVVL